MSSLKNKEICLVPLQDLGTWCGGGTPSKQVPAYWENGTIPWVSPKDMKVEHIGGAVDSITEKAVKESATNLLPAGSVLVVTRSGILRHTFPVAVTDVPVTINQDLKALVPSAGIDSKFVAFALRAFSGEILNQCSKQGTTVNSIETKELLRFQIPLFSPELQTHIVAEIEKQLSRLDEAVANLKRVKANLKRYKAAVLKAAVEGKLTEEWRKQHPDVEPADKLLERILAERRKAAGKGKYKEPVGPDTSGLPELPAGWVWASVVQLGAANEQAVLTGPFGSNIGKADFLASGVPVLTIGCLKENGLSLEKAVYVSEDKATELERYKLKSGDMLFSRMASVGRAGFVTKIFDGALINYHIMRLRLSEEVALPMYFVNYVRGAKTVVDYVREVNHGATRDGINTEQLQSLPVALPPLDEQHQIVAEVEHRLSIVAEAEAQVDANLRRADRLRQSILKQAFSGQLVPQDSNDEPASMLLERMRATKSAETKEPVTRARKSRTPAPKTGEPSPKPLPLVAETTATYGDAITARILATMQPGRQYARADLVDSLGLTTGQWNAAIQELKRVGKVRQVGERRGARYCR